MGEYRYTVLYSSDLSCFEREVSNHLNSGWSLHGNLIVKSVPQENFTMYYQAMVNNNV
jgi:hypothetical protein